MGMSLRDAADWDFVEYSKTLTIWNKSEAARDDDGNVIETEPPPIEWMMADDEMQRARGYKVN